MPQSELKHIISLAAVAVLLLSSLWSVELSAQRVAITAGFQLTVTSAEERALKRAWKALNSGNKGQEAALATIAELERRPNANSLLLNEVQLLQSKFWLNDRPEAARTSYEAVIDWVKDYQSNIRISPGFRRRMFELGQLVYAVQSNNYAIARLWIEATEWLPNSEKKKAVNNIWTALQNTPYHLIVTKLAPNQDEEDPLVALQSTDFASAQQPPLIGVEESRPSADALVGLDPQTDDLADQGPLTESMRGWLELASEAYFALSADQQYQIWQNWIARWPDHLAAQSPPTSLKSLPKMLEKRLRQIAFLLPLSGDLASVGIAIQEGILTSHFKTSPLYRSRYSFFDTAGTQSLRSLYDQAIKEGAQMIVGPLEKEALAQLAKFAKHKVPILGLNYLPDGVRTRSSLVLYQFGLSATDEHRQIVSRALQEAGRRILIIRSGHEWSIKNATLLAGAWRDAGGEVVDEIKIESPQIAVTSMAAILGINLSNERAKKIRRFTSNNLKFQPRRRRDIDAIILVTEPEIAKAVKPALAYYFADTLPVYALNRAIPTDDFLHPDLSGVRYCDLPWRIHGHEFKALLEQFRPEAKGVAYNYYALGVDVAGLLTRLPHLDVDTAGILNGATGRIKMSQDRIIRREMAWAKIIEGRSLPLDDWIQTTPTGGKL